MADTTKKRKMLNPILMKELKLGARSIRLPLTVMFYDIVLAIVAMCVITNLCLIYKFIYLMENLKNGIVSF